MNNLPFLIDYHMGRCEAFKNGGIRACSNGAAHIAGLRRQGARRHTKTGRQAWHGQAMQARRVIAALVKAELLINRAEQIAELAGTFSPTQKQEAAWPKGKMK